LLFHSFFPSDSVTVLGLKKDFFRQLLEMAVKNSFFPFDSLIYHQIDGVAMGSPLGPILANIFLAYREKSGWKSVPLVLDLFFIDDMSMILFCCLKIKIRLHFLLII